jgi:hypothetical protein
LASRPGTSRASNFPAKPGGTSALESIKGDELNAQLNSSR